MDFFTIVSEDKIRRAMKDGEFDNLPGFGKPLPSEDLSFLPEDLRMAYRMLKNANMIDGIDRLQAELMTIDNLIDACDDAEELERLARKKREKQLKFEDLLSKRKSLQSPPSAYYKQRLLEKLK